MKRFLLGAVAILALGGLVTAQVNVVPQVGVISGIIQQPTYSAVALALPPAASATDIACITGSATKVVKVRRIMITGTAGTLVTAPFTLVKRDAANTGGTAATTTADWANTVAKNDNNSAAHSATLIAYSANPTITDSTPQYMRSAHLTVPVTSAGVVTQPLNWQFGGMQGFPVQEMILRGAAQQACINLNGVSISTGLLHLSIEWTEEN